MTEQPQTYDPSEHTVDEVNAYLDEHPEQAEAVLAAEGEAEKPRVGITEGPHAVTTTGGGQTVTEAGEHALVSTGEKYEKGYDGFVPSRDGDNPVDLSLAAVTGQKSKDA